MRAFDVHATAIALDVSAKWLDNLLSHHDITGVVGGRQGVRRLLQPHSILRITVAIRLIRELGTPVHRAVRLADQLVDHGRLAGENGLELRIDIASLARELDRKLAEAAEAAAPRRRGRPRGVSRHGRAIPESSAQP